MRGRRMLLKGQVAIVTGGGRGIGRAIAKKFAAAGASVVVSARTEKEIEQVAREIQDAGGKAASVAGDVSREPDCEKIVREARNAFGAVHVLVNNAGLLGPVAPMEQVSALLGRSDRREFARAVFAVSAGAAGNVRPRFRLDLEHCEHCGEGGLSIERRICRIEGGADGTDAHAGGGRRAQGSARERAESRAGA